MAENNTDGDLIKSSMNSFMKSVKDENSARLRKSITLDYTNQSALQTFIQQSINAVTVNYGMEFAPFINGRYVVHMKSGPWTQEYTSLFDTNDNDSSKKGILSPFNHNLTNLFTDPNKNSLYPMLATDIDIPEITKEYINVSTRAQTLSAYQREIFIPDFSISYLEDTNLSIFSYHEAWHKMIELYKRGDKNLKPSSARKNSYFYEVPYSNAIWVVLYDMSFNIRGLFYMPGVRPISLPIKQLIGNRSDSKMTVYNIQYKGTALHYQIFPPKYTFDSSNGTLLEKLFFAHLANNNSSANSIS